MVSARHPACLAKAPMVKSLTGGTLVIKSPLDPVVTTGVIIALTDRTCPSAGKELEVTNQRQIEIFSAGCPLCEEMVAQVGKAACASGDVSVRDMTDPAVATRAKTLGVRTLPAVAMDGKLADCCTGGSPDLAVLQAAGLGQPHG
jgi:hypothetical protein